MDSILKKGRQCVPVAMSGCSKTVHAMLNHSILEGKNPSQCRLVIVTGKESTVHMEDVVDEEDDG